MQMTIRCKITLIMLLVIIISVTSIGVLAFNNAKAIILNEVKQSSFKTLQNVNEYFLRKFMSEVEYVVSYWAEDEEIKNYKNKPNQPKMVRSVPEHFKNIANQWTGYTKGSPYIAWLYLGPQEDGSLFVSPLDPTMPDNYDCRTRVWYKKAVENSGKAVWSDPYLDAGEVEEMVVTVSRAVENEKGLVGVVGMDIKLSQFYNIINNIRFGDEGYLMLMTGEGEIFSHPDEEILLSNISDDEELAKHILSERGNEIIYYQGKQSILSYMTVPETGWKLVGIMPIDVGQVLAPIKNRAIYVTLISILFTFLIGSIFSKVITQPLGSIMKVIHHISQGKLNEHIHIKSKDEFKILGDRFNDMIDTLRGLIEERNQNVEKLTEINEETTKNYLSTVKSLANAIEANDKYTRGHCERVSKISMTIAKAIGIDPEDLSILEFASILHDIGKIGIPSTVLNKEGKLTKEEFDMIKKHPQIGYDILSDVEFLYKSRRILLQHHERIDGKGYPLGLKGQDIDFLAKIISVADAYDAMTSSRPYRKIPLTKEEAIDEMIRGKGTQFEEGVVDCFVALLADPTISL